MEIPELRILEMKNSPEGLKGTFELTEGEMGELGDNRGDLTRRGGA